MQIEDFKSIVESNIPKLIQDTLISFKEADAIISNYNRLREPYRSEFLKMPIGHIIEFALTPTKQNGSFKDYIKDVETKKVEIIAEAVPISDNPPLTEIVVEPTPLDTSETPETPKKRIPKPLQQAKMQTETAPISHAQEMFYKKLLEQVDRFSEPKNQPIAVTVESTELHVERLFEIEQSMLSSLAVMTEQFNKITGHATHTQINFKELFQSQQTMIQYINESQHKIVEVQGQIITAIDSLANKIAVLAQTSPTVSPIVNVPAPIVNVVTESGRRLTTKFVERDENGLISKIIEDDGFDD